MLIDFTDLTTRRIAYTSIIVGLLGMLAVLDWRYRWSYSDLLSGKSEPEYQFNLKTMRCEDRAGKEGNAANQVAPCGLVSNQKFSRVLLPDLSIIAMRTEKSTFRTFIFEWLQAHGSQWINSVFESGQVLNTDFFRGEFQDVVFDGVHFEGTVFYQAGFSNVTFKNSSFRDVSFNRARFKNVKFLNTTCIGCAFLGAKFDEESSFDQPFQRAFFDEATVLPIPTEMFGKFGFEYAAESRRSSGQ